MKHIRKSIGRVRVDRSTSLDAGAYRVARVSEHSIPRWRCWNLSSIVG